MLSFVCTVKLLERGYSDIFSSSSFSPLLSGCLSPFLQAFIMYLLYATDEGLCSEQNGQKCASLWQRAV